MITWVDWNYWRTVVAKERPDLYEDFDEAEGDFLGWRYKETDNAMSYEDFQDWVENRHVKK